jgi:allantoicase
MHHFLRVVAAKCSNDGSWRRTQPGAYEGMKAGALPTLGIKGRFRVYGAGLEPMSALENSTIDRAGAANGGSPPIVSNAALFTKVAFGL